MNHDQATFPCLRNSLRNIFYVVISYHIATFLCLGLGLYPERSEGKKKEKNESQKQRPEENADIMSVTSPGGLSTYGYLLTDTKKYPAGWYVRDFTGNNKWKLLIPGRIGFFNHQPYIQFLETPATNTGHPILVLVNGRFALANMNSSPEDVIFLGESKAPLWNPGISTTHTIPTLPESTTNHAPPVIQIWFYSQTSQKFFLLFSCPCFQYFQPSDIDRNHPPTDILAGGYLEYDPDTKKISLRHFTLLDTQTIMPSITYADRVRAKNGQAQSAVQAPSFLLAKTQIQLLLTSLQSQLDRLHQRLFEKLQKEFNNSNYLIFDEEGQQPYAPPNRPMTLTSLSQVLPRNSGQIPYTTARQVYTTPAPLMVLQMDQDQDTKIEIPGTFAFRNTHPSQKPEDQNPPLFAAFSNSVPRVYTEEFSFDHQAFKFLKSLVAVSSDGVLWLWAPEFAENPIKLMTLPSDPHSSHVQNISFVTLKLNDSTHGASQIGVILSMETRTDQAASPLGSSFLLRINSAGRPHGSPPQVEHIPLADNFKEVNNFLVHEMPYVVHQSVFLHVFERGKHGDPSRYYPENNEKNGETQLIWGQGEDGGYNDHLLLLRKLPLTQGLVSGHFHDDSGLWLVHHQKGSHALVLPGHPLFFQETDDGSPTESSAPNPPPSYGTLRVFADPLQKEASIWSYAFLADALDSSHLENSTLRFLALIPPQQKPDEIPTPYVIEFKQNQLRLRWSQVRGIRLLPLKNESKILLCLQYDLGSGYAENQKILFAELPLNNKPENHSLAQPHSPSYSPVAILSVIGLPRNSSLNDLAVLEDPTTGTRYIPLEKRPLEMKYTRLLNLSNGQFVNENDPQFPTLLRQVADPHSFRHPWEVLPTPEEEKPMLHDQGLDHITQPLKQILATTPANPQLKTADNKASADRPDFHDSPAQKNPRRLILFQVPDDMDKDYVLSYIQAFLLKNGHAVFRLDQHDQALQNQKHFIDNMKSLLKLLTSQATELTSPCPISLALLLEFTQTLLTGDLPPGEPRENSLRAAAQLGAQFINTGMIRPEPEDLPSPTAFDLLIRQQLPPGWTVLVASKSEIEELKSDRYHLYHRFLNEETSVIEAQDIKEDYLSAWLYSIFSSYAQNLSRPPTTSTPSFLANVQGQPLDQKATNETMNLYATVILNEINKLSTNYRLQHISNIEFLMIFIDSLITQLAEQPTDKLLFQQQDLLDFLKQAFARYRPLSLETVGKNHYLHALADLDTFKQKMRFHGSLVSKDVLGNIRAIFLSPLGAQHDGNQSPPSRTPWVYMGLGPPSSGKTTTLQALIQTLNLTVYSPGNTHQNNPSSNTFMLDMTQIQSTISTRSGNPDIIAEIGEQYNIWLALRYGQPGVVIIDEVTSATSSKVREVTLAILRNMMNTQNNPYITLLAFGNSPPDSEATGEQLFLETFGGEKSNAANPADLKALFSRIHILDHWNTGPFLTTLATLTQDFTLDNLQDNTSPSLVLFAPRMIYELALAYGKSVDNRAFRRQFHTALTQKIRDAKKALAINQRGLPLIWVDWAPAAQAEHPSNQPENLSSFLKARIMNLNFDNSSTDKQGLAKDFLFLYQFLVESFRSRFYEKFLSTLKTMRLDFAQVPDLDIQSFYDAVLLNVSYHLQTFPLISPQDLEQHLRKNEDSNTQLDQAITVFKAANPQQPLPFARLQQPSLPHKLLHFPQATESANEVGEPPSLVDYPTRIANLRNEIKQHLKISFDELQTQVTKDEWVQSLAKKFYDFISSPDSPQKQGSLPQSLQRDVFIALSLMEKAILELPWTEFLKQLTQSIERASHEPLQLLGRRNLPQALARIFQASTLGSLAEQIQIAVPTNKPNRWVEPPSTTGDLYQSVQTTCQQILNPPQPP